GPLRRRPDAPVRHLPLRRPRALQRALPDLRRAAPARDARPGGRAPARIPRDGARPLPLVPARGWDLRLGPRRLPGRAQHAPARARPLRRLRRLARAGCAPAAAPDSRRRRDDPRPRRRSAREEARAAGGVPRLVHDAAADPAREALAGRRPRPAAPRRLRRRASRLRAPPPAIRAAAAVRAPRRLRGLAVSGPVSRAPARVGRGRPAAMAPRPAVSHLGLDAARRRPRARPRLRLPPGPAQAGGGRDARKPDRPAPERPAVPAGRA